MHNENLFVTPFAPGIFVAVLLEILYTEPMFKLRRIHLRWMILLPRQRFGYGRFHVGHMHLQ